MSTRRHIAVTSLVLIRASIRALLKYETDDDDDAFSKYGHLSLLESTPLLSFY